jgi:hypothetical protein
MEKYKRILDTRIPNENILSPINEIDDDRLQSWVQIPTRNIRRGGWKRQYAVLSKNKLLFFNSEKDHTATICIDLE